MCGLGVPAQPPSCPWSPAATSWESESRGPVPGPVRLCIWGTRGPTARTRGSGPPIHLGWLGVRHPGFALTSHAGEPWGKQRRKRLPEGHRHGRRPPRRVCASGGPRRGWGGLRRGPPIPLAPPGLPALRFWGTQSKTSGPQEPSGEPSGEPRRATHSHPRVRAPRPATTLGRLGQQRPQSVTRGPSWPRLDGGTCSVVPVTRCSVCVCVGGDLLGISGTVGSSDTDRCHFLWPSCLERGCQRRAFSSHLVTARPWPRAFTLLAP